MRDLNLNISSQPVLTEFNKFSISVKTKIENKTNLLKIIQQGMVKFKFR